MSKGKKAAAKGKGKKGKDEEQEGLLEAERELLNITITDLNQKMERMKSRCMELEMSNVEFQRAYEQLDEDRADVIAYLKRQLEAKEGDINELNERLTGLHKQLEETIAMYEAKIKEMENEYKNMSEQLTSEVKLLIGKLNAIEEFRIQRDELMAKFKQQKEDMEQQVEENRRAVYEVEKKFVIDKDKLKKDMQGRLVKLAMSFQDSTQLRIAATTHRVIRENIAVNNELDEMLETHRFLVAQNKELKEMSEKNKTLALMFEGQKDVVMSRNNIQCELINRLSVEYEKMVAVVGDLQHSTQRVIELENQLTDTNTLLERAMKHIATLEERIRAQQDDYCSITNDLNKSEADIVMLRKVLMNAMQSVEKALEMQKTMPEDEAYKVIQSTNLLKNMLMLFHTAALQTFEETEQRVKSVMATSAIYGMKHVELLRESTVSSPSTVTVSEPATVGSQPPEEEEPIGSFHFLSVESIGPSESVSVISEELEEEEESSEEESGTEEQEIVGESEEGEGEEWAGIEWGGEEGDEIGGEGEEEEPHTTQEGDETEEVQGEGTEEQGEEEGG